MPPAAGSFGEELREHRRRAGLTQRELARRAGVSVRAVRNIEQGRVRQPRPESVRRLAAAVGLHPAGAATADGGALPDPDPDTRPPDGTHAGAGARCLAVGVLGPLTVHRGSRPVAGPHMQRSLLGLLAIQPNQVVGLEDIIDTLWGEHPPPTCHNLVRGYVARLRKLLEPEPARAQGAPARVLISASRGYVLTVGDGDSGGELEGELELELDLLRFDELVAAARDAQAADPAAALELLAQALGCWRGPVLADLPPRLRQHPAAVAASQRRVTAALALADLAIGLGEHRQAVERLRGLAAEEPLHEGLHARLMLALAGSGEQAAALELFAGLRERLVEELGVEPGAELQEAQARVLQGDLPGVRPGVRPPDRQGGATASAVVRPRPAQLPADVAGFTGRDGQLGQLDDLLQAARGAGADGGEGEGTAVVLTAIAGTAGVGKTALAVHWAHRVADRFDDGQLYVNLQGYASAGSPLEPVQALAALLRALGVAPEVIPADTEQAAGLYRSLLAGRRLLVMLDNARAAEQVRPLLPGSPTCMVLITSRDRLTGLVATHGAHRLTLDVLPPEEAVALLGRVLGAERVAAEPEAARELAEACAFLPLALRIAAANLTGQPDSSQPIAAYLAELQAGDRLAELMVDGDPQAAVRVAFDASYQHLTADARRVFRLLGLAPGPDISVQATAALAELPPKRTGWLLKELVDVHLVEPCGVGRVSLHDLLRRYAREQAQQEDGPDECAAAIRRLLEWYLHAADVAAGLLYPERLRLPVPSAATGLPPAGFDSHARALAWLDTERANLVAAVWHAALSGPQPLAWLLADALRGYFWACRHMTDWLSVAEAGLTAAIGTGDARAQAASQFSLGSAYHAMGRHQQAIQPYTTALVLARQAGWTDGQAAILGNLATLHAVLGNPHEAARHNAQALPLFRQTGRLGGQATTLLNLGDVNRQLGNLTQAADQQLQALDLYRKLGAPAGEAFAFNNLGEIDHDLGRLDHALEHLTRALTIYREVGDRNGQTYTMRALAAVHRDAGRQAEALELAQAAVALSSDTSHRLDEAMARNTLASIQLRGDRPRQAAEEHRQALALAREAGARAAEAAALLGLAAVDQHTGRYSQAADQARHALASATQSGFRLLEGQAHYALAGAYCALGRHAQALTHARQALALYRHSGHRLGQARTLRVLGCALRDTGDLQAAPRHWQEALELFTDIGSPEADEVRKLLDA